MEKKKFRNDLMQHLESEYEKYKGAGVHDTYHSGYCGAVIGIMNWIKEYEFISE